VFEAAYCTRRAINDCLSQMTVYVRIRQLVMTGNYTICGMFSCSEGPYTVTMDGVLMTGLAQLEVGPGGRLRAEDISLDVSFDDIHLDFRNLGYTMSMFQASAHKQNQIPSWETHPVVESPRASYSSKQTDF